MKTEIRIEMKKERISAFLAALLAAAAAFILCYYQPLYIVDKMWTDIL